MPQGLRVNVGCGATPTAGWINLDNSWTVRLCRSGWLLRALSALGIVGKEQIDFATVSLRSGIRWASAFHLPLTDGSVDVLYSSHMLEHLSRAGAKAFLAEARRVLRPGGVIRLALPDLGLFVRDYLSDADADRFVFRTRLADESASSLRARVKLLTVGPRHHRWMYDAASAVRLLEGAGFMAVRSIPPGETRIVSPEPLDLRERVEESLYVEGERAAER